jgi:hypothetical protein
MPPASATLPFCVPRTPQRLSSIQRLANASERSSIYSIANGVANANGGGGSSSNRPSSTDMSLEEQAHVRQEFKECFALGAR